MVVAIIGLIAAIAMPVYARMHRKAQRTALMAEATEVHQALKAFYLDHNKYPAAFFGPDMLNTSTLAPLTTDGYLSPGVAESFLSKQAGGFVNLYIAFWVDGEDREIWMFIQPDYDPNEWIYLFDTQLIWGSQWHDGVFIWDPADNIYKKVDEFNAQ
jgi:type II secretory pathway pseudopilin PulG